MQTISSIPGTWVQLSNRLIGSAFLVVSLLCTIQTSAQDLLVLTTGDSLSVRILEVTDLEVTFIRTGKVKKNEVLPLYEVRSVEKGYFEGAKVKKQEVPEWLRPEKPEWKGFKVGMGVGYSYLIAEVDLPPSMASYASKMKNGFHLKAEGTYFFGKFFGLGLNYTYFHSSATTDGPVYATSRYSDNSGFTTLSDNIHVHLIALNPTARIPSKDRKVQFMPGITLGYIHWTDHTFAIESFVITTGAFAYSVNGGLDFAITRNLSLGIKAELILAVGQSVTFSKGDASRTVSDKFNMSRIEAGAGLRYYW